MSQLWKINVFGLLEEILGNPTCFIMAKPFNILISILRELAKRAIELDDKELNKLMLRLSLYEIANPESSEFDQDKVTKYLRA